MIVALKLAHCILQSSHTGDFLSEDLAKVINQPEVTKVVAEAWAEKANKSRSTIAFAVNVNHAHDLAAGFQALDPPIDARVVHGKTPPAERELLLQDFRDGLVRVDRLRPGLAGN